MSFHSPFLFRFTICSALMVAFFLPTMMAQELTWDADLTPGNGPTDGGGSWITDDSNLDAYSWYPSDLEDFGALWPDNQVDGFDTTAIFGSGGTAGTISVVGEGDGTVYAGGLRFNAINATRAYTFDGGTIHLRDGGMIDINDGATSSAGTNRLRINSALAGQDITIARVGVNNVLGAVQLNGNNTWTGTLTLSGNGTSADSLFVEVFNANSLKGGVGGLDAVVIQKSTTLAVQTTGTITAPLILRDSGSGNRGHVRFDQNGTLAGNITLDTNNAAISTNNASITATISGDIGETGGRRKLTINSNGLTGTVVLSGSNTFSGGLEILAGKVRLGSSNALNSASPNVVTFTTNSSADKRLILNGNSATVGGLASIGTGTVFVENANASAATLTIENAANQTFRGVLRDGTGGGALSVIKDGSGTQILQSANTYTGDTTVRGGVLQLDFASTFSPQNDIISSASGLVMGGGTLDVKGGASAANSQTFDGLHFTGGASTIMLSSGGQNISLDVGTITRSGGSVNFVRPDTMAVIRATGSAPPSGSEPEMLGGWATLNGSSWAALDENGEIVAFDQQIDIVNKGPAPEGVIPNDGTADINIVTGGTSGNMTLAGGIGTTDINTLQNSATDATTIQIDNGAILRLGEVGGILAGVGSGELNIGSSTSGGFLTAGGAVANNPGELLIHQYSTSAMTINARVVDNGTGAVSLVKNGTGLTVLANTSNSYSGKTYINGGTLRIMGDGSLGRDVQFDPAEDPDNITFNGGTLQWGQSFNLHFNRGITLQAGGGTLDTQGFSTFYDGAITGIGGLTKTGIGVLTLAWNNDYKGVTRVNQGVLIVANNQALGSTDGGTVVAAGRVVLLDGITVAGEAITINGNGSANESAPSYPTGRNNNGALQVITGGTATWQGDVIIGTNLARIGGGEDSLLIIDGVIRNGGTNGDQGSLDISTSGAGGVVQFNQNNIYTGDTRIVRGTLRLGINNAVPQGTRLQMSIADSVTELIAFDLNGFDQMIAGLVSGPTNSNGNQRIINSGASTSKLTINQNTNTTYKGSIQGDIEVEKDGSGTLTLDSSISTTSGAIDYTGKTTIKNGTLALAANADLLGTPWIQVDSGAFFNVAGRTGGGYAITNKVLSGRGTVVGNLTVGGSSVLRPGDTSNLNSIASAGDLTGALTIDGNLTLQSTGLGGDPRVVLQLGGSGAGEYDRILITGDLTVENDTSFSVEWANDFQNLVSGGMSFDLFDWNGIANWGNFNPESMDFLELPDLASLGLSWDVSQFLNAGVISIVPEPSRIMLLLLGAGLFLTRRRRARLSQSKNGIPKSDDIGLQNNDSSARLIATNLI